MSVQQYIIKPKTVSAVQYRGDNKEEILEFTNGQATMQIGVDPIIIPTPKGDEWARVSDWIVKGVKGEFYLMRNDVFHETYEQVK